MFELFLVWLTAAYLTRVLLFDGSIGPFERGNITIIDGTEVVGHPDLFDFVRRLFGAYKVVRDGEHVFWYVNDVRMTLWRCPKCLGFWISIIVNIAAFKFGFIQSFNFLTVFSTAFVVAFLVFAMRTLE